MLLLTQRKFSEKYLKASTFGKITHIQNILKLLKLQPFPCSYYLIFLNLELVDDTCFDEQFLNIGLLNIGLVKQILNTRMKHVLKFDAYLRVFLHETFVNFKIL